MTLIPMDKPTYSQHWETESSNLEDQGIYQQLCDLAPVEDVLEIGCGAGIATLRLAESRKILSIDNNVHLIGKARSRLSNAGVSAQIIHANLFDLSHQDIGIIKEFSPKGIVCWFIGSDPYTTTQYTPDSQGNEKPKKYRENIEDLIISKNVCQTTVKWIHLANRAGVISTATDQQVIDDTKSDYNTYVFSKTGFEVSDVKIFKWNRDGSDFMYANAANPNLMPGKSVASVVSIFARRV
jgi:hypothetical protein